MQLGCCDCVTVAVAVPGPPGPAGSSGDGEFYHEQITPSSSWDIDHDLGKLIVGVLVYSLDLTIEYTNVIVEQLNANQCRLWFSTPIAGIARIF